MIALVFTVYTLKWSEEVRGLELKFDHIIHYVHQLNEADINFMKVINGGKHETLGTYNKLSYTDLSYIEFIDAFDRELVYLAVNSESERLSFAATLELTGYKEGFKRLCFRTDNIVQLKEHLNNLGVSTIGPTNMKRVTPEGKCIEWQLLYIDETKRFELPFFIQWQEEDDVRERNLSQYFQGNLSMEAIEIETTDFDEIAEVFVNWIGYEVIGGVINSYFKLVKEGSLDIYLIPGNQDSIKSLIIKSDTPEEHHFRNAVYKFI